MLLASPIRTVEGAQAAPSTGCGAPRVRRQITDWGALTNLGPNLEIQGVVVDQRFADGTITGTFPSTVASGDAITGPDIPGGHHRHVRSRAGR